MSNTESLSPSRKPLFVTLVADGVEGDNLNFLAAMLASLSAGQSALPCRLGLSSEQFGAMMTRYFPDTELQLSAAADEQWRNNVPEYGELEALFDEYAVDDAPERSWIAAILIAGCTGHQHLWEDLGLFTRHDLSRMLACNFPGLAARNDRDMKWKKFIYKQLCEREGIIACPAPTCDACADFKVCFASEEEPSQASA